MQKQGETIQAACVQMRGGTQKVAFLLMYTLTHVYANRENHEDCLLLVGLPSRLAMCFQAEQKRPKSLGWGRGKARMSLSIEHRQTGGKEILPKT